MRTTLNMASRMWLAPWIAVTLAAAAATLADNPASDSRTPGVEYRHLTEAGPQSIHGVRFDLARTDLALAAAAGPGVQGKKTVPELVAHLPPALGRPVAAVNGDYFEYKDEPRACAPNRQRCYFRLAKRTCDSLATTKESGR